MVNCLQIIAHYPLINVLMPANCQLLFTVVVKIATFDLIPVDGIMEEIKTHIKTAKDSYTMPENLQEFGYESTDPVQNLAIIFLFSVGLLVLPLLILIVELISSFHKSAQDALVKWKNENVYWNFYLRFLFEAYLELALSGLLRIKAFKFSTSADIGLTLYAFVILMVLVYYAIQSAIYLR